MTASATRRAIDLLRRRTLHERKHDDLGRELETRQEMAVPDLDAAIDDHVGDDLLRLVFTACHPVLSSEARVALTLRLLGGLTTEEIARAFLVREPTVAQRIVRAKRTLAEARVPFEVPRGAELAPNEPEVHGLVALMEIQASRTRARVGPSGEPILLLDQDRARWDHVLVRRGLAALERAEVLGGALGPYALQAAIAACHARARTAWRVTASEDQPDGERDRGAPRPGHPLRLAARSMASRLRSTSSSVVAHDDTLIRMAVRPCQTVPPHQQVPSS